MPLQSRRVAGFQPESAAVRAADGSGGRSAVCGGAGVREAEFLLPAGQMFINL